MIRSIAMLGHDGNVIHPNVNYSSCLQHLNKKWLGRKRKEYYLLTKIARFMLFLQLNWKKIINIQWGAQKSILSVAAVMLRKNLILASVYPKEYFITFKRRRRSFHCISYLQRPPSCHKTFYSKYQIWFYFRGLSFHLYNSHLVA